MGAHGPLTLNGAKPKGEASPWRSKMDHGHIYKIQIRGVKGDEYYEFERNLSEEDVKEIWIQHGVGRLGLGLTALEGLVEVQKVSEHPDNKPLKDGTRLD